MALFVSVHRPARVCARVCVCVCARACLNLYAGQAALKQQQFN